MTYIRFCTFFLQLSRSFEPIWDRICPGRGHKVQGIDRSQLAYWNPMQPGLAIWGVFWTSIFILVNGYQVFFVWNTQNFLTAYINIPIFFALWIGWTVYMRTPFWRAHEMDFVTVRSGAIGFCKCRLTAARDFRASRRSRRLKRRKSLPATWVRRSSILCFERLRSGYESNDWLILLL